MRAAAAFALCAAALLPACAGKHAAAREQQPPTVLEVQNDNYLDMDVFLLPSGGARIRLGEVTGHSTARLTIPARYIFGPTPLRFQAHPVGSGANPVTQEIQVSPGDTVVMQIPPGG